MEKFLVVYLDDILIFSKTAEEHDKHIRYVLDRLREHQLHAGLQKCRFFQTEIEFVGYLLTAEGIHMLPKKVDAILNWPVPTTASQVKSFLGLATFYRHFVEHFAHKAIPLYQITRKNQIFTWLPRHQEAFEQLKLALTTAPVLAPPDFNLPFEIHTDASDFAAGAVLSQEGNHPIAFLSHVFKPAELNYSTYDKEFLAIILALRAWRHYIHGHPTTVYTDHQALISIQTQTFVNRRHNRYLQFLAEFGNDLIIKYKPGRSNVVADALSRIPNLNSISTLGPSPELLHEFAVAYVSDPLTETFFTGGAGPTKWSLHDGFIYEEKNGEKLIYVPASKSLKDLIIHDHHDAAIAGHLGRDKTIAAIGTTYTWPGMREDIARYVAECPTCQVVKSSNQVTPGLLSPLDIPCRRWEQIHIDLIGPLPVTPRGFDAIVTIVDRLSKAAVFIPTTMTVTARQLAEVFFNNVFRHYGLPSIIISDRDPRFTSNFWRALMDHLGISLHMTAAYHPQSDGQAERHNRTIQDMLRAYVNPSTRDDWDEHLVALEFAYNNSVNRATGFSPFFMLYGQNPNTPASLLRATVSLSPAVDDFLARITETLTQSRTNLAKNQEQMQNQVNKRRRFVRYEVGERVLVDASRLYQAPRGKLTHKWVGPFEVAEVLNDNAYVLHLPPRLKNTSSTFNVTQLKRYQETDREFPRPPPIGYESGQPLYEFEKILAHRGPKNNRYYLVKWKGWPVDENLYEPASNLSGVQADVDAYEASIPVQRRKRSRR
ncbi:putative Transposon Ty3-I Gag-Pol polyprotein [Nannochloris sp. 'desiccata']|nr:putative Transposon Ty3-I Gag-Pol polyprotein [Chlorella desiccata (nom. nud.)]